MSQEQPPIRSRRELRKGREAQKPSVSTATDELSPAPRKPAATRPAPGTAAPAPEQPQTQRSSQIRERDSAALRTIKELEEREGQPAGGSAPTRRQLRQQLKEHALTAANPMIAPAGPADPGAEGAVLPAARQNAPAEQDLQGGKRTPSPTTGSTRNETPSRTSSPSPVSAVPDGMTVEQALTARLLIAEQAENQIAKMQHIASLDSEAADPEAVDPEILAEQIALAERAAAMNRRATAKQKLAEQTGVPAPAGEFSSAKEPAAPQQGPKAAPGAAPRPAPSAASNLAMVTPLEFIQVPGVDRPVMRPPATSHIPVITRSGTKVAPPAKKGRPAGAGQAAPSDARSGRSQLIAGAEAAAKGAVKPQTVVPAQPGLAENHAKEVLEDLHRVPARQAHGLDPLDAGTAGLARATWNRVLQVCVLAFGILALVAGILLILSGMSP